jgi:hypothetical protein
MNLYVLIEFVIPVLQDYGCALKQSSFDQFDQCYKKLMLLYLLCTSKGAHVYQMTMLVYDHIVEYWKEMGLPIWKVLSSSPTFFSEESGEVALSTLTIGQSSTSFGKF